mmetsp:Transcript_4955/g.12776  ORF Transcript_4955/g.12776 Transcript_4955/m.12776 type:complete len:337 (-) Transcript_4955:481-1491(-)
MMLMVEPVSCATFSMSVWYEFLIAQPSWMATVAKYRSSMFARHCTLSMQTGRDEPRTARKTANPKKKPMKTVHTMYLPQQTLFASQTSPVATLARPSTIDHHANALTKMSDLFPTKRERSMNDEMMVSSFFGGLDTLDALASGLSVRNQAASAEMPKARKIAMSSRSESTRRLSCGSAISNGSSSSFGSSVLIESYAAAREKCFSARCQLKPITSALAPRSRPPKLATKLRTGLPRVPILVGWMRTVVVNVKSGPTSTAMQSTIPKRAQSCSSFDRWVRSSLPAALSLVSMFLSISLITPFHCQPTRTCRHCLIKFSSRLLKLSLTHARTAYRTAA